MNIRTLIIEDEPLARRTLRDFIADFDWLALIGEASDGLEAIDKIEKLKPRLIFLDVRMPEVSGLEVLRRLTYQPAVVFTTAFEQYAVKAFEFEALDYLQKPFGRERFRQTIERIRKRLLNLTTETAQSGAEKPSNGAEPSTKIFVRRADVIFPIDVREIIWFEANGDYVNIYTSGEKYITHGTLTDFSKRLTGNHFLRVHRSAIVNLDKIDKIEEHGRALLIYMNNGSEVQASRTGSRTLRKLIA